MNLTTFVVATGYEFGCFAPLFGVWSLFSLFKSLSYELLLLLCAVLNPGSIDVLLFSLFACTLRKVLDSFILLMQP